MYQLDISKQPLYDVRHHLPHIRWHIFGSVHWPALTLESIGLLSRFYFLCSRIFSLFTTPVLLFDALYIQRSTKVRGFHSSIPQRFALLIKVAEKNRLCSLIFKNTAQFKIGSAVCINYSRIPLCSLSINIPSCVS